MKKCHRCHRVLTIESPVGRREVCPFCGEDLHVCQNCRFYEPGAYNDCREPSAERVVDKNRSNFCDYFSFRDENTVPAGDTVSADAKQRAEALFKK